MRLCRSSRSPSRSQLGDCVTETVYRHELRPGIRSGANATDRLFPAPEPGLGTGAAVCRNKTRTTDDATCLDKSCQAMYQVAAAGSIFTGADLANAASPGPTNPRGPGGPAAPGPAGTNEPARSRGGRVRSDSCTILSTHVILRSFWRRYWSTLGSSTQKLARPIALPALRRSSRLPGLALIPPFALSSRKPGRSDIRYTTEAEISQQASSATA